MKHSSITQELWNQIGQENQLEGFFLRNEKHFVEPNFVRRLNELRMEKGLVREQIIRRADIDSGFGHQIFRGTRHPSRDKVLQLAFGFPLTLAETQRLLICGNKRELHPRIRRDAIVIFGLNRGLPLMDIQDMLFQYQLPLLGEEQDRCH